MNSLLRTVLLNFRYSWVDPDVRRYLSYIDTQPHSFIEKYDQLARSLKKDGLWDVVRKLHLHLNGSPQAALVDFRNPAFASNVIAGGLTWAAATGFTANGVDGALQVPQTMGALGLTQNSCTIAGEVTAGTNGLSNSKVIWGSTSLANQPLLAPRGSSGFVRARLGCANSFDISSARANVTGKFIVTRRGATDVEGYEAGASVGSSAEASTSQSLTSPLRVFQLSSTFADFTVPWVMLGTSMTNIQAASFQSNINNYLA